MTGMLGGSKSQPDLVLLVSVQGAVRGHVHVITVAATEAFAAQRAAQPEPPFALLPVAIHVGQLRERHPAVATGLAAAAAATTTAAAAVGRPLLASGCGSAVDKVQVGDEGRAAATSDLRERHARS